MPEDRNGAVITFYSYKGGTGRSMALANVAWILAANGYRVLVADWDLESPGLHRFYKPYLPAEEALGGTPGVIDLIREYEYQTTREVKRTETWYQHYAKVRQYAISLKWDLFNEGGSLDFLSAGRQNDDYAVTVSGLDWDTFFDRLQGARFFEALRADMKRNYDFTLVDSRTGLSDVADICTLHLPDVLVDCFTLSDQGIEGAARVARRVRAQRRRQPRILPVPMRVDPAEKEKADAGRALAARRFGGLPADMSDVERRRYWAEVEVPYFAFYAYEETLAVFGDAPGARISLLPSYEALASAISNGAVRHLPEVDPAVRDRERARYLRKPPDLQDEEIVLRYAPEDTPWAEWIERQLMSMDIRVADRSVQPDTESPAQRVMTRTLTIVSASYQAVDPDTLPPLQPEGAATPIAVYVSDVRPLPEFAAECTVSLANQPASAANDRLIRLVGRQPDPATPLDPDIGPRFPGTEPQVFSVPARNARFTGREDELAALRDELQTGGRAVVLHQRSASAALPVTLHGMGGVGKTQLALEYAHRFRTSYDVVWWVPSDPPQFVDTHLTNLANQLGVTPEATDADTARAVLKMLRLGDPSRRWLLIYDNAEELDRVDPFMPRSGPGHVIVTSRNSAWTEQSRPISIDVFRRGESIVHLRQRVARLTEEEAASIADVLGDLPIAVAAAGAWLAESGQPAAEYLRTVEQGGSPDEAVQRSYGLSLDRLKQQAPAAYKLLQFCSVLAPEIALDLLTNDEMAEALKPIDASVSERDMRLKPIQQMNRFALIKLDSHAKQFQIHRLLQAVVRSRMSPDELSSAKHQVHMVLARSRPRRDVDIRDTWPNYRLLWPHLEISGAVDCPDESVRQLLIDRVRFLWLGGDLEQGEELARRIVEAWQKLLAKADASERESMQRQLLHLRFNLANLVRALGRFEEARTIDEEVLKAQIELLGADHAHPLLTAGGLAADLRALGRFAEALPRAKETYETWLTVLGEDSTRTLTAASNLAVTYRALGNFREARQLDGYVLSRREEILGADDPNTLNSASCLGRDLREAGEYERSVEHLRGVLNAYVERYGPEDLGTLNAQANLAVSLRSAGRPHDAVPLLDEAYRGLSARLGPTNPDTLACRLSRAATLLVVGTVSDGVLESESVAKAYQETLGEKHPHALVCLNNLAVATRVAEEHGRALEIAEQADRFFIDALGESHPYAMAAAMNVAACLAEVELNAAYERMRHVVDLMSATLGPSHPDTLCCQANVAITANVMGARHPGNNLTKTLELLSDTIGKDHPVVTDLKEGRLIHRILDPHPW
jgi:tetratricopeptide (TPR) repeat protein/CO dehydrogenase nickel-insertion accessory protein CooC1